MLKGIKHTKQINKTYTKMQHCNKPTTSINLLLSILLLILLQINQTTAQSEDYFCGLSWSHAADTCPHACPTGDDTECHDALEGNTDYGCFFFTGCYDRIQAGDITAAPVAGPPPPPPGEVGQPTPAPNTAYPTITPTYSYTLPIKDLISNIILTLKGVSNTIKNTDDITQFINIVQDALVGELDDKNIIIETMNIVGQQLGASFDYVDITLEITAKYTPKPSSSEESQSIPNIYDIANNYIGVKNGGRIIIAKLKMAGLQTDSSYFDKVSGLSVSGGSSSVVGGTDEPTMRPAGLPTVAPTGIEPTAKPTTATPQPTLRPTKPPVNDPSVSPTLPPTRPYIVSLETTPLNFDGLTAKSFGYIFNVRTTTTSTSPVLITGLNFYTITPGMINYELWSKLGSYVNSKGNYDDWEMISSGTIQAGSGPSGSTIIPEEGFISVEIPAGGEENGGIRAFYITLNTNDLIYRKAKSPEEEDREADTQIHDSNEELEMWEGEAVLNYPFPNPDSQAYFYKRPMQFVGLIKYDRELGRTMAPSVAAPTSSPSEGPTTIEPTTFPTMLPTFDPANDGPSSSGFGFGGGDSKPTSPSFSSGFTIIGDEDGSFGGGDTTSSPAGDDTLTLPPSTSTIPSMLPTSSPINFIKANILMTLRFGDELTEDRLMLRNEVEAFLFAVTTFFNDRTTGTMRLDGLGLFSQEFILVNKAREKKDDNAIDEDATAVAVAIANQADTAPKTKQRNRRRDQAMINALQLQVVLKIIESSLPNDVLGNLAAITIRDNEDELLNILKVLSAPYPYFEGITGVDVLAIDELIRPPSEPPVMQPSGGINTLTEGIDGDDGGGGGMGGVIGGVIGALLLVGAAAGGFVYHRKRKRSMMEVKDDELEGANSTANGSEKIPLRGRIMTTLRSGRPALPSLLKKSDSTLLESKDIESGDSPGTSGDSPGSIGVGESNRSGMGVSDHRSSLRSSANRGSITSQTSSKSGLWMEDTSNRDGKETRSDSFLGFDIPMAHDQPLETILSADADEPDRKLTKEERKAAKKKARKAAKKAKRKEEKEQAAAAAAAESPAVAKSSFTSSTSQDNLKGSMTRGRPSQNSLSSAERYELEQMEAAAIRTSFTSATSQERLKNSLTRPSSRDNLKNSLARPSSRDNLRGSMRRSTSRDNLRGSMTRPTSRDNLRGSLNLRKSLVDKEFEAAILDDGLDIGFDDSAKRADRRIGGRSNNLRSSIQRSGGDLRNSLVDREFENALAESNPRRGRRGDMKRSSTSRDAARKSRRDFSQSETQLDGMDVKLTSSQTKKKPGSRPVVSRSQSMQLGNSGLNNSGTNGGRRRQRHSEGDIAGGGGGGGFSDDNLKSPQTKKKKRPKALSQSMGALNAPSASSNWDLERQSVNKETEARRSGSRIDGGALTHSGSKKKSSGRPTVSRSQSMKIGSSDINTDLRGSNNSGNKRAKDRATRKPGLRGSGNGEDMRGSDPGTRPKRSTSSSRPELTRSSSQRLSSSGIKQSRTQAGNDRRRLSQSMTVSKSSEMAKELRRSTGGERSRGNSFDEFGNDKALRRSTSRPSQRGAASSLRSSSRGAQSSRNLSSSRGAQSSRNLSSSRGAPSSRNLSSSRGAPSSRNLSRGAPSSRRISDPDKGISDLKSRMIL